MGMSVVQVHICRQATVVDVRCKVAHTHTHSLTTTLLAQSSCPPIFTSINVACLYLTHCVRYNPVC